LTFRGETSDTAHLRSALRSMARDMVLRQLYQRCERLLYVGTQAHEHYTRLGCPESSLVFSPYCVDESNFQSDESARGPARSAVRRELGIAEDALVLMFSGKLTPRKGVDLLSAAVRQLPDNVRQRCVLLFVGDGSMRQELERECASATAVSARFVGFQNQTQLSRYYHASDLLVLPSRGAETWGVVVNEALLHGVPCVTSTAVGSHRDLVISGVSGEVCAPDDVKALSAALKAGLQLGNTLATRERCREVVAKFSTREAAAGIARAYKAARRQTKANAGTGAA
jgi:glycosyltransferase involved in cell wall biosynthesis